MTHADIVVGYGFGDEGKGATVDFLARLRSPDWVVRFNGGAQAAHNVVTPRVHHTFNTFGSALLANSETQTYLGPKALFDPVIARYERRKLTRIRANTKLFVHPDALVVTPWHAAISQLREVSRGDNHHGSCGMGIGAARADEVRGRSVLRARDLPGPDLKEKLRAVMESQLRKAALIANSRTGRSSRGNSVIEMLTDAGSRAAVFDNLVRLYSELHEDLYVLAEEEILADADYVIFEGAQGVLLDEYNGFHPHTTWTDCTANNADEIIEKLGFDKSLIAVMRGFATRHGAGPFPTEDPVTRDWAIHQEHNAHGPWQGGFRTGWFDIPLMRYAIQAAGVPDRLVLTCLDRFPKKELYVATGYSGYEMPDPPEPGMVEISLCNRQRRLGMQLGQVMPELTECKNTEGLTDLIRNMLDLPAGWDSHSVHGRRNTKVMRE